MSLPNVPPPTGRSLRGLLAGCALFAVVWAAFHLLLVWSVRDGLALGVFKPTDESLGAIPLYMQWREPHLKTGALIAAIVLAAFIGWFAKRGWGLGRPSRFVAACLLWQGAIVVSVATSPGGMHRLWRPYELLTKTDYIGAVDRVGDPRAFLHDYPQLMSDLPMHCQTHPPGGVVFLWLVSQLFGPGAKPAALATIATSLLALPAVYALARGTLPARSARFATALWMLAPSIVLFSATCLDAVFMVPLVASLAAAWHAREAHPWRRGALAGLLFSLGALLTFSASFVALWGLLVVSLTALIERDKLATTLQALAAVLLAVALFHAALYAWAGYDPWTVFQAAVAAHGRIMSGGNHASFRQHVLLASGNLAAFLAAAGISASVLWMRNVASRTRWRERDRAAQVFDGSFVAALAIIVAAPLYTLEVEHIWLFMVPLASIGAARALSEDEASRPDNVALGALTMAAVQTLLMETLLSSVW